MSPATGPLWLVGCGNMGGAMLRRWIATGMDAGSITVITRGDANVPAGVRALHAPPLDESPAVLVLAVKPQQLDAVAASLGHFAPPVLVSILAGVESAALSARFKAGAVVRAMPNLPVAIGKGVTVLYTDSTDRGAREIADALAAPLGLVEWLSHEDRFDAVTALAGCGPGFVFRFADALAQAGSSLGLPVDQAARLALVMLEGAAAMAAEAHVSPATLADRVASPGGSTRAGLDVLDRDDALVTLLTQTLAASTRRNAEMAAAAR